MKKLIAAGAMLIALTGCEEATKAIDQAQDAANKAVDSVQDKVASLDFSDLNLDQLGEAAASAKQLVESVEDVMNADFSDPQVITDTVDKVANAYSCFAEATSDSSAQQLLDKVLETVGSEQAQSLVEKAIEKAQNAKECVM